MNLSKRSEYALRALIDLGIARELGRPILQVSELALKEKLPIKFLEQILTQLRLAGYVETKRGKFGGYSLAKPAARIKLGCSHPRARWSACADRLREPDSLPSLHLPG